MRLRASDHQLQRTLFFLPRRAYVRPLASFAYQETTVPKHQLAQDFPGAHVLWDDGGITTAVEFQPVGRPEGGAPYRVFCWLIGARRMNVRFEAAADQSLDAFKDLVLRALVADATTTRPSFPYRDRQETMDAAIAAARTPLEVFAAIYMPPLAECDAILHRTLKPAAPEPASPRRAATA